MYSLVFRWIAIPWIQAEVDDWVYERNHSCVRADKHKVLPHGIPAIIASTPEYYGACDFKVSQHFYALNAVYSNLSF